MKHPPLTHNASHRSAKDRNVTDEIIEEQYDSLFGGEKLPSLFNKTHGVGTTRAGIIMKAPEDRQSRFFKEGGQGALKYWGPDSKPTDQAMSPLGQPNKPCLDTVFVLYTDYRMSEPELEEADMDMDSGNRGVFASGGMKAAIRAAIKESGAKKRSDLVGARLTLTRTGKEKKGDYKAWTWKAGLELGIGPKHVEPVDEFED